MDFSKISTPGALQTKEIRRHFGSTLALLRLPRLHPTMVFPNVVAFGLVGVVKFFLPSKGYGFIATDNGDIYMNAMDVVGKAIQKGAQVTFDTVPDTQYQKLRAINIEAVTVRKSRVNSKGQVKTHKVKVYQPNHALVLKRSKEKREAHK